MLVMSVPVTMTVTMTVTMPLAVVPMPMPMPMPFSAPLGLHVGGGCDYAHQARDRQTRDSEHDFRRRSSEVHRREPITQYLFGIRLFSVTTD
ncbi:hypothetical protein ENSA7_11800 [Enhygromyxa salina]|uniref:Uncharacterized protein n=1 Tax=Enhygromyxa salina TaxID=215803 RepID=A0A2S9YVT1_9BACT|nr:hypothetical protein ENSA7_11800 [Enhygromyxa salina]